MFIEFVCSIGVSDMMILFSYILLGMVLLIVVFFMMCIGILIIFVVSLLFFGLGV